MGDWFERLVGFRERDADVRQALRLEGDDLVSDVAAARYKAGAFATPSLGELRARFADGRAGDPPGGATFTNVIGDAAGFHGDCPGATFQVACVAAPNTHTDASRKEIANISKNDPIVSKKDRSRGRGDAEGAKWVIRWRRTRRRRGATWMFRRDGRGYTAEERVYRGEWSWLHCGCDVDVP